MKSKSNYNLSSPEGFTYFVFVPLVTWILCLVSWVWVSNETNTVLQSSLYFICLLVFSIHYGLLRTPKNYRYSLYSLLVFLVPVIFSAISILTMVYVRL